MKMCASILDLVCKSCVDKVKAGLDRSDIPCLFVLWPDSGP